ncbi:MAG: S9 family peptidase [Gemmataceae bacterium]|nr:S9 family peptidase [Gemmataceae bacterium]
MTTCLRPCLACRAALLACLALVPLAPAQGPPAGEKRPDLLTVDRIFASADFRPESYGPVRWLRKHRGYTLKEPSEQRKGSRDIVRIDPDSGRREVVVSAVNLVPPGEESPLAIDDYQWSADESLVLISTNSKRVWRKHSRGDYWVFDVGSRELRKLGGGAPPATLMNAHFSPDSRKVAYVRDRDIYVEDLATRKVRRLTKAESPHVLNGAFDWVYEEEFSLYDGFRWSPDSSAIAFWQLDPRGVDDYLLVNQTDGLYQQLTRFKYPKAGRPNSACRVGVVLAKLSEPWPGKNPALDPRLTGVSLLGTHGGVWLNVPGGPRDHYIARMDWAADSKTVVLQQLNRLQNTNQVILGNANSGQVQTSLVEQDKAWVDVHDHLHWLDSGKKFTWLSERDGWRRAYVVARDGKQVKAITPPGIDVIDVAHVDDKNGWLYYYASPADATRKYLHRVRLDGGSPQRVTPEGAKGTHEYDISPDGRWAIHTFSTFDTPPVVQLVSLPDHKTVRPLAENKKLHAAVKALKGRPVEFFRIDIGSGVELDGWCLKPPDLDSGQRYPVLFHVYGEPWGQTVLDRWGGSWLDGSVHLWHRLLAQQGYLVMSVDNRGTPAPRGRDWRKVIYRQVGILASQDQASAVRALCKKWAWVDPGRVGIWGWSGGGSMSLNAIFRYPDLYHAAMAVAPVTNQRYYDTIYQERYMGLPRDNPEGYRDGSPITHAHRLKGNLLVVHGTADDNVHYANTEALVNELIAHNKQFTMMGYPNRSHSISEGPNTRRHLFTLLTRFLRQHLPPGPRPSEGKPPTG